MPIWWIVLAAFFTVMVAVCGAIGLLLLVELVSDWREERRERRLEALAAHDAQRDARLAEVFAAYTVRPADPVTELDREWLNDLGIVA